MSGAPHIIRDRFKQQNGIFFGRKLIDNSKQVKDSRPFALSSIWQQSQQ